jgi:predicted nucleic acid-binding protein
VIVLDANILLYAYDMSSEHHAKARAWIEQIFSSGVPIGLPRQTVAALLRVVTPQWASRTVRISTSSLLNKHLTCNGLLILNFAGAHDGTPCSLVSTSCYPE